MIGMELNSDRSSLSYYANRKNNEGASKLLSSDTRQKTIMPKINIVQQEKMTEQQIKKAYETVRTLQKQLKKWDKNSDRSLLDRLRIMEESIRRKNIEIKDLESQVNYLKNTNLKPKAKQINVYNLFEEIKQSSLTALSLKKELDQRRKIIGEKRNQLDYVVENYAARCKKQGKQFVDIAKFKQMQDRKKKQPSKNQKPKNNPSKKQQMSMVWQDKKHQIILTTDKNENRIKDTHNHRNVAEAALKTERKRHRQEMSNFYSKLDFLKDEEEMIEEKIRIKEQQLKSAEKRFSQSRNMQHSPLNGSRRGLRGMKIKTQV